VMLGQFVIRLHDFVELEVIAKLSFFLGGG